MKSFNWRVFLALWLASIVGVLAVIPFSLTLQAPLLAKAELPVSLEVLLVLQIVQNVVLFAGATAAGLLLARRVGLGAPILEAFFAGQRFSSRIRTILPLSIGLGILAALAIIFLDIFIFVPALRAELGDSIEPLTPTGVKPPVWQGLLGSLYGGINEEIFMRLFLLSLFAFLGKQIRRTPDGRPTSGVLWTANVLAAFLFGLGHLPAIMMMVPLSTLFVARVVLLNGVAGVAFGYLYCTRGLEAAILSHFIADIVLHVLVPLLL